MGLGAGEKERGTLETILTSPASILEILTGKFVAVSFFGIMSAVFGILGMLAAVNFNPNIPEEIITIAMSILTFKTIFLILTLLIPITLFFAAFLLAISSVNDSPVLSFISDQQINEDESLSMQIVATDVDTEDLTYGATLLSGDGAISFSENNLDFVPSLDWYGDASISVSVSDGEFIVEQIFNISVVAVNDSPVVTDSNIELDEDSSISFDINVSDVDNDTSELTVLLLSSPNLGTLTVDGLTATSEQFLIVSILIPIIVVIGAVVNGLVESAKAAGGGFMGNTPTMPDACVPGLFIVATITIAGMILQTRSKEPGI